MASPRPELPPTATLGLLLTGIGLLGMTAGELPGIPAWLGIPTWFMGAVAGALIGLAIVGRRSQRPSDGTELPLVVSSALAGVLLVALGDAAGWVGDRALDSDVATTLNTLARLSFGAGAGVAIGWLAFESGDRRPP